MCKSPQWANDNGAGINKDAGCGKHGLAPLATTSREAKNPSSLFDQGSLRDLSVQRVICYHSYVLVNVIYG
jgi:hypothetical protein